MPIVIIDSLGDSVCTTCVDVDLTVFSQVTKDVRAIDKLVAAFFLRPLGHIQRAADLPSPS